MTDLISFDFDDSAVRAVMITDNPWWVANDIAQVLGYRDAHNMARNLDDDEKGTHIVSTLSGDQSLTIISESGLFAAILKSRKPEAKRFRRWVTGEVLPALRRHGRYAMPVQKPLAAPHDSASLSSAIACVREARRLFGHQSARVVWMQLGLPVPIANGTDQLEADPLAHVLESWLDSVGECTIEEAAEGIGLDTIDGSTRLRIGALLRLFGWFPKKKRRGRIVVNLFTPATVTGSEANNAT